MIGYAQIKLGAGFQLDRALFYYAQRLVTIPVVRRGVAALIAAGVRLRHGSVAGLVKGAAAPAGLSALKRDGVAVLPPMASEAAIGRMVDYFRDKPVVGPDGRPTRLDQLPADVSAAAYDLDTVVQCPELMETLNAPAILQLAAEYLGCKPTLSSIGVRWSLPSSGKGTDTQRFHRDLDDWRFLKLFIYLTDVDERSGPHIYVRTSQKIGFGVRSRFYGVEELKSRYGAGALATITGPRGTSFVADTQGIHCGAMPIDRPRLILQAQYSLLPVFAFLYEPVDRIESSADDYINRLIMHPAGPTRP